MWYEVFSFFVDELLATQTSASNNDISGYTLCANEWESFALPGTCDVAYGEKGAYVFRSAQSGTITFNNATFGDPAQGTPKKGYYRLSGGQRFYAHANYLYSVAALTNGAGAVVERYRYDTYGNRTTLAPDGITTRAASSYNQQVGFTGRYLDKETSLWYFRARYYSGSLGRFVSRDSILEYKQALYFISGRAVHLSKNREALPAALDSYVDSYSTYFSTFVPNGLDPTGNKDEKPPCLDCHMTLWIATNQRFTDTYYMRGACSTRTEGGEGIASSKDGRTIGKGVGDDGTKTMPAL